MTMPDDPLRHVSNDSTDRTLDKELQRAFTATHPDDVRIATAYMTPDGFKALNAGLQGAGRVRVLLGERPFLMRSGPGEELHQPGDDETLDGPSEAIDWWAFLDGQYPWILLDHERRAEMLREHGEEMVDAGFNLGMWAKVQDFVAFLRRDGVEMQRFLGGKTVEPGKVLSDKTTAKVRLHAKAYLMRGAEGAFASVGSSNLTMGGLTGNIELNLTSYDEALVRELEGWFDSKWRLSQDCREEYIKLLEQCVLFGKQYTPWHIFIKALHAAYGKYLDLTLNEDIAGKLAEFQQEAVTRCVGLLERHWGAMLCDSVGLGKTFEGLGILAEFTRRRQEASEKLIRALVICPAQLEKNWSHDKFMSYGIVGETVTMESLPRLVLDEDEAEDAGQKRTRERKLKHLQSFDVVLVDESHNFRNPATKRYRALQEVIRGGVPDKRVVLLTATPINNTPWDLYWQLQLITRGDDTWYANRGPVSNLRLAFRAIEKKENPAGLLDAMLLSLVRRTRHDIRALQASGQPMELAGQPMKFPEHEIPEAIDYSLKQLYGGIYNEIIATIQGLSFAVYDLESYGVQTEAVDATTEGRLSQRNKTFIGIMKTIFLKRMESSVVALGSTVGSMVDYLDLFLKEMDERNRVLTPKVAQKLKSVLGGILPDDVLDEENTDARAAKLMTNLPAAPTDDEERARLKVAVQSDRAKLASLRDKMVAAQSNWESGDDPKLQALRKLLEDLPAKDANGVPSKAVIFTNYKDTADYIFRGLGGPANFEASKARRVKTNLAGERWMSKLTGGDDQKRRLDVLQYFAPLAFNRDMEASDDPILLEKVEPFRQEGIDILISTDVLSEGQNLQDAQFLINYDLPWNPVRIIQRAGRIDRLFSPHGQIKIFNIMPEQELETLLSLVKRLRQRISSIEDMVGLDASVLGEQIEEKSFDQIMKLRRGGKAAEEVYLEGERSQGLEDAFSEMNKYIDLVKELGTKDVREVPDGAYSIRLGDTPGIFVMLKMPEDVSGQVYWRFYPLPDDMHANPIKSAAEVLKIIEATRDDERQSLADDDNPFQYLIGPLNAAIAQLGEEYRAQIADRTQDDFTKRLAQLMSRDDVMEVDEETWRKLHTWRQQPPPTDALQRSKVVDAVRVVRQTKAGEDAGVVAERLRALWDGLAAEGLDRPFQRPEGRAPSVRDLQLICWELVVTKKMLGVG